MKMINLLQSVGSTEPTSFNDMLRALGDECPEQGDKAGWRELFALINNAERAGWIDVDRPQSRIDIMQLTSDGVAELKRLEAEA